VQPHDIDIYKAFMSGMSVGAIAKNYKLDKSQVKKVINRVANESKFRSAEVLQQLHDDEAITGRGV
jgi:Mor family transcriptional regulator